MPRIASCFALFWLLLAAEGFAEPLSFEGWTAREAGSQVEVRAGAVTVRYESPQFAPLVVQPAAPIPLPDGTSQVRFWCARMEGDCDLRVLVRDARGVEHAADTLTSRPAFPAVPRSKMREWSAWRQVESISLVPNGRIEAHVQPEFQALARKLDWPQPLSLTGIEIRPAKDRRDNEAFPDLDAIRAGKGRVWLAGLGSGSADGLHARFNWFLTGRWRWGWDVPPRLFLDDLTIRRSGPVRYALELRHGYQGPLVWRLEGAGDLDRADAAGIFSGAIELPPLPAGRYFLEAKSWRPSGELDRQETMELFVIVGEARALPVPTSPFVWETGQPHHVFNSGTTEARLTLRCDPGAWPGRSNPARCVVRIKDWRGRLVGESEHEKADALEISCAGLREGTDYTATAEFTAETKVLDRVALHFGMASRTRESTGGRIPPVPSRDELFLSRRPAPVAELFGSALAGSERGQPPSDADLQQMDRWQESLPGLGFKLGSFMFGWGECEPLPGVFRWEEIERRVELGRKLGLRMFLTPTLWGDSLEWPRWKNFQPCLDQFGYVMQPGQSGVVDPAVADPVRRENTDHWLRSLAIRFRDNPNVVGYRTKPLNLHGDNKPQATRPDCAPVTQLAFQAWLRARGEQPKDLGGMFLLPGQNPLRTGPDLSPDWQRFMDFRIHEYVESVRGIVAAIRAVDPQRQIHIYRSSTPTACEAAIPLLADGAEFHDEGGPFYFQRAVESLCLQAGIPYTNEGHQFTPPSRAMIDAGFFYGSLFDRGWSWLYRWHARRHEDSRFAALPQVMEFVRDSQPALAEWVAGVGEEPQLLVFGSRTDRLVGSMRTGIYSDIAGLDVFAALFAYHGIRAHFSDEFTPWVDLERFKCVLAVGDVMRGAALDQLARFARDGGKLVLVGEAGRLCANLPAGRDGLRQRLTGLANVKSLPAPASEPPAPGPAFRASPAFNEAELEAVLTWAGVERGVRSQTPGFECARKRSASGDQLAVAVFRRFPGEYDNIWYDDQAEQRWGRQPARVVVEGLADGDWKVEQFHRTNRAVGQVRAEQGRVEFDTGAAVVGELQLFRLRRGSAP